MGNINVILKKSLLFGAGSSGSKGDILRVPEKVAANWIQTGYASKAEDQEPIVARDVVEMLTPKATKGAKTENKDQTKLLPEDFPAREDLIAHGLDTIEKVRACGDLTEVSGVGEVTEKTILEALEAL